MGLPGPSPSRQKIPSWKGGNTVKYKEPFLTVSLVSLFGVFALIACSYVADHARQSATREAACRISPKYAAELQSLSASFPVLENTMCEAQGRLQSAGCDMVYQKSGCGKPMLAAAQCQQDIDDLLERRNHLCDQMAAAAGHTVKEYPLWIYHPDGTSIYGDVVFK